MAFLARIFYLSSARITTDACKEKGAKTNFEELSRKQTLNYRIGYTYGTNLEQKSVLK